MTNYWHIITQILAPNQREQLAKALLTLVRSNTEAEIRVVGDGQRIVKIIHSDVEPFERPAFTEKSVG